MRRTAFGFAIYFKGLRFWLHHRTLVRLSLVPLFINLVCLVFSFYIAIRNIPELTRKLVQSPEAWYQYTLYYAAFFLTTVTILVFVLFVNWIIANLIAFPFNSLLAERALSIAGALPEKKFQFRSWLQKTRVNLGAMAKRALFLLFFAAVLFFTTLVPGLGILGAGLAVFIIAWNAIDYSFDSYQMPFNARWKFIMRHLLEIIGFAAALGLTASIPVINMISVPGSVVAGSCLIANLREKRSE